MDSEASCRGSVDELERRDLRGRNEDTCCCCFCDNCPPHLFTSILLGLLACVLVSGGVFLAFHKWDHTWLLVSAVGVLLMMIGTALHCCSASQNERKTHTCKGGCSNGRSKPDTVNTGLLSEQLLPLSNARSVSQLSLNMVPGYFPPLVYPASSAPYGLEQHSAVVQNISRLVQHQQQLHLQSPSSAGDGARSFILLPLPNDANAANIQNLVAAVCQLDANCSVEQNQDAENTTSEPSSQVTTTSSVSIDNSTTSADVQEHAQTSTSSQPLLKHVEVQTCNEWPNLLHSEQKAQVPRRAINALESSGANGSSSTVDFSCQTLDSEIQMTSNESLVCIIDSESPVSQQQQPASVQSTSNPICDIVELPMQNDIPLLLSLESVEIVDAIAFTTASIALDNEITSDPEAIHSENILPLDSIENQVETDGTAAPCNSVASTVEVANMENSSPGDSALGSSLLVEELLQANISDRYDQSEGNSAADSSSDLEDSELLDRSSPPPSYDDVTHVPPTGTGAFGVGYGTL